MFLLWSGIAIHVQRKTFCFMFDYDYLGFPIKRKTLRGQELLYKHVSHSYHGALFNTNVQFNDY